MAAQRKMVTAVFRDRINAERAFDRVHALGYANSEINVLMSEKTRATYYTGQKKGKIEAGSKAAEGLGVGGAVGTAVGATLGAIVAAGTSILLPGIGLIAGPIAGALAGAGAGAVTGGIIGVLVGWGIPENNAKAYEAVLKQGGIVLGVVARKGDDAKLKKELEEAGGEDVVVCNC